MKLASRAWELIDLIQCLEISLAKLDSAQEALAASKIAEAIEILKANLEDAEVASTRLHHDND